MFKTPKTNSRVLVFVLTTITGCASFPVCADIEEVAFQAAFAPFVLNGNPPAGPAPMLATGNFFFDTATVTGGLLPGFNGSEPPGDPGTADVSFKPGQPGQIIITYANGAKVTEPFLSGFSLSQLFQSCGPFADCGWGVGHELTLSQFKAMKDPWALILDGLSGGSDEFSPTVPAVSPGSGFWDVVADANFEVQRVPEPSLLTLLALGLSGLAVVSLSRRRKTTTT